MTKQISEAADFAHDQPASIGVLIANLGTPDAPTPQALRRYLGEFLWDPRVVDGFPRWLWWLILHGIILRVRPRRSAAAYQAVWTEEGSPLLAIARRQCVALAEHLRAHLPNAARLRVELGMRYGSPSIGTALERLRHAKVQQLLVLPLYPQYSCSTTASVIDAVAATVKTWRRVPELRFVNQYHDDIGYIAALATSITEFWRVHQPPERLLFSFHGTPRRFLDEGDPYYCQCQKTARLVAERLQLADHQWQVSFQSIFGREPWLQPYTIEILRELARKGGKRVHVICPGFSADCLETLEEIEVENRHAFVDAGGQEYHYIPALNDRKDHIAALASLIGRHTEGWEWPESDPANLAQRLQRARALGAAN